MATLGFIMTRHVTVKCQRANDYWKEAVRCIRRFYRTNLIMIIDDNSDKECLTMEGVDAGLLMNCMVIQSDFPGAGEFLPYYYLHKYRLFERAVIMHDSVFLQEELDLTEVGSVIFLWHFSIHRYDIESIETGMIRALKNHESILKFYHKKHLWMGCFGVQTIITLELLDRLQEKYNVLELVHHVKDRTDRSCMERVLACILTYEEACLFMNPSMLGDIYEYTRWGYTMDDYQRDRDKQTLSVVKIWSSR